MRELALALVVLATAGCATTQQSLPETDLKFRLIRPVSIDAAYIWSGLDGGYVAHVGRNTEPQCYDIISADGDVADELALFDDYPEMQIEPAPHRFTLTIDAVATVPPSRATYSVIGDGEPGVSSSAWYRRAGAQVFLNCPDSDGSWPVYRVTLVRALDHSAE